MNQFLKMENQFHQHPIPITSNNQTVYALVKINPLEESQDKMLLDLRMILDNSGSMGEPVKKAGTKMEILKKACMSSIELLSAGDRLTVYAFSTTSKTVVSPTVIKDPTDIKGLKDLIKSLSPDSATHITSSLEQNLKIKPVNKGQNRYLKRAIVFTDGEVNYPDVHSQKKESLKLAHRSKQEGVPFWVYGVGTTYNEKFLQELARHSGGSFEHIGSPQEMIKLFSTQLEYFKDVAITGAEISMEAMNGVEFRKISRVIPDIENYPLHQPDYFAGQIPDIDRTRGIAFLLTMELSPVFKQTSTLAKITIKYNVPSLHIKGAVQELELMADFTHNPALIERHKDVLETVSLESAYSLTTMAVATLDTGNDKKAVQMINQAVQIYDSLGQKNMSTKLVTLSNAVSSKKSLSSEDINTRRTLTTSARFGRQKIEDGN